MRSRCKWIHWIGQNYCLELKRLKYIDIAKGIGIILVVVGHLTDSEIQSFIYLFHMPLFFYLSGLLFHNSDFYIRKKTKQFVIPFIVFSIITFPIKYIERSILQGAMYLNISYLSLQFYNIPLWFCISLYTISCIYYLLVKYCRNTSILLVILTLICLGGLALSYSKVFLPLYLSQSLLAFPFYVIGHISSNIKNRKVLFIISIIILTYAQIIHINTNISGLIVNHNPMLYLIPALSGIYVVLYMSKIIEKYILCNNDNEDILSFLGRNSLYIFALHWPFITIFQRLNDTIGINRQIGSAFIFFAIIIIPLLIGWLLHFFLPRYFRPICR